jgi:cyclopropane-fatty-acyl-phospholipid synthase
MFMPLHALLTYIVRSGNLTAIDCSGRSHCFGDGSGENVTVRFTDRRSERAVALDPHLAAGEAYMRGTLLAEQGTIYDFLALVMRNLGSAPLPYFAERLDRLRLMGRRLQQYNPVRRARRNVRHHYDINPAIYDLFLDRDRQYSCAYFEPGSDLEQAQLAKKRHIAAKLALHDRHRVLDIGSGWGGLALYLAKNAGCDVLGVTLSAEQIKIAGERAAAERLASRVTFEALDYRELTGTFDRIVSVGMFEHVGINHYGQYFSTIARLLDERGVALVHSIARSGPPCATNAFIARYIFPGGYLPSLSEVLPAIERAGLIVTDLEILRLHYAKTLRAWRERFMARRADAVRLEGEAFARMWEFYLAGCEAAFRYQNLVVIQVQLAKRVDALPIRRDYMFDTEREMAATEANALQPQRMAGE